MSQMIRSWYKNLDSDQQIIIKATASCLLLTCFISFFTETTDSLFLIFVASSFVCSRFFAQSNPTMFSQKMFTSKNGKVFSLQERRKYWLFLILLTPLSFFIAGVLPIIVNPTIDFNYCFLGMAVIQVISSRMYLFYHKTPLRAFALPFYGHPHELIHSSETFRNSPHAIQTSSFQNSVLSPIPNSANGYGSIGPSRRI